MGLVLGKRTFRLVERRLIGTGVDLEEEVALLHVRAVGELALDDLTVDLRLHGDRFHGDAGADLVEVERFVVGDDFGDRDQPGRGLGRGRGLGLAAGRQREGRRQRQAAGGEGEGVFHGRFRRASGAGPPSPTKQGR